MVVMSESVGSNDFEPAIAGDTSVPASADLHVPASPPIRVSHPALRWLVTICRFFLVALFLVTAVAKLTIISSFAQNVGQLISASGFDYERWTWPVTIAVILLELATVVLLLIPRMIRMGAAVAAFLLLGFAAFALYYVYVLHGEPLECGCFGRIIGSQLGVKTALRNLILLLPAVLVWFGYRKPQLNVAA